MSIALKYARANSGITFRPDANTVLWLPGQDDPQSAVIRDRSGQGNNGTILGPTWVKDGKGLWYLLFDATDDTVTIPLAQTQLYTFQAWIKPNLTSGNDYIYTTASSWTQLWLASNGVVTGNTFDTANNHYATISLVVTAGKWALVTNTVDTAGDRRQIYVNDAIKKDDTTDIEAIGGLENWQLGRTTDSADSCIALVRIYSKILTATEIAGTFNLERHLFGV